MGGQVAAAVCGDQLQAGMPVQYPGEDEVGQRDGVLGRLPHGVGQVPAVQPLVERAAEGVQEEERAGLLGTRPEGGVGRIGEFPFRCVAGDLDAQQALGQGVFERAHRLTGVLERHEAQPPQSVGRGRTVRRGRLVGRPVHLLGRLLVRPVVIVRGGGADELDVHALGVHRGQPYGRVGQPGDPVADHGAADGEGGGAVAPCVESAGLGMAGQSGHERVDLGQQHVCVHVDGRYGGGCLRTARSGFGHGRSLSMVMVRPIRPGTSASRTPSSCHCPIWTDASTTGRTRAIRRS